MIAWLERRQDMYPKGSAAARLMEAQLFWMLQRREDLLSES